MTAHDPCKTPLAGSNSNSNLPTMNYSSTDPAMMLIRADKTRSGSWSGGDSTHKNDTTCFNKSIFAKRKRARNGGSMLEVLALKARNIAILLSA